MILIAADGRKTWRRRTARRAAAVTAAWVGVAIIVAASFSFISRDTVWSFVWDAPAQAADILGRLWPPQWSYAPHLARPLWDTLTMATLGTALAVLLAVPAALLAARNTTPSRHVLRPLALFAIVTSRSINTLIWGLVLVVIVGPGVLAGIIAIGLRSIGFIGKLLYEAIEESDPRPPEAVAAAGASHAQVVAYGVAPQVAPAFAGITVFRWDINIRESTVLGLVGAGGIGVDLNASIGNLDWSRVAVMLVLVFASVAVAEWISARVRKAVT